MRARLAVAAAVLALAGALAVTGSAAGGGGDAPAAAAKKRGPTKRVKVADNFFAPKRFAVKQGTTIRWRWSNANADSHDVFLRKGPRGVRRFQSPPAATFFTYKRKLTKPGVYKLLCTFHEGMTMRVTVRKR